MVRRDLAVAGIPYRDEAGRVFDFHAIRHQFLSNLARSGVHPKIAQQLARHLTITLTMDRYTHTHTDQLAEALSKLPPLADGTQKGTQSIDFTCPELIPDDNMEGESSATDSVPEPRSTQPLVIRCLDVS